MRPSILNKDYTITAEMTVPEGGAEGMIATLGGRFGGYGLYLLKGKPVFVYNLLDLKRFRWEGGVGGARLVGRVRSSRASTRSCSTSNTTAPASARAAPACSRWMARSWPRKTIPHTIPFLMAIDETFDIGIDTRTAVDDSYKLPFRFTGTIDKLTFKLGPEQLARGGPEGHAACVRASKRLGDGRIPDLRALRQNRALAVAITRAPGRAPGTCRARESGTEIGHRYLRYGWFPRSRSRVRLSHTSLVSVLTGRDFLIGLFFTDPVMSMTWRSTPMS